MSTPETKLRIFMRPSGNEIVFSENSATFVSEDLEAIDEGTQIVRDVNGNLRSLGNAAFRKYRLSLSCNDNRLPPLANLWAGQVVDVEMSTVIAERGTTPSRTAVAGTVSVIGSRVEYRPRLTMMITRPPALSDVEWQGRSASWSMELEEVNGATDVPVTGDRLILAAKAVQEVSRGAFLSVGYAPELTKIPDTQGVSWSIVLGSLPPGLSLNAATGVVSGTPTEGGVYAFSLRAQGTGDAEVVQTYVFDVAAPALPADVWAQGTGGVVTDYTDANGIEWRCHTYNATAAFVASVAGVVETLPVAAGGGAGFDFGGGGGGGGVPTGGPVRVFVPVGSHPVEVGAGGAPGSATLGNRYGRKGSDSSFRGISAAGGGGGIGSNDTTRGVPDGGSGGGDGPWATRVNYNPGTGVPGQGFGGGVASAASGSYHGGGGGGAGAPGFDWNAPVKPMCGGDGIVSDISGASTYYGGGGSSIGTPYAGPDPVGGLGGGGSLQNKNGAPNTGGGGAGALGSSAPGGTGGSGVVRIRYRRN